jgi:lysophospholipase L1-like esterase
MTRNLTLCLVGVVFVAPLARAEPNGPAAPIIYRTPNAGDARPTYQPGMLWLDQYGQSWMMTDGKPGRATWVYRDPSAPVVDDVGGKGPLVAYGTRRMTSSYNGQALNLSRTSDAAKRDIGFLPDGRLDEATLGSFCARTECRVAIWYDQSGNRQDAVQTDPKAQPLISLAHRTGNSLSVDWDYEAQTDQPPRWLVLPPTLTVVDNAMAVLWAGRFHSASLMSPLLEIGGDSDPFSFGFWDAHGSFYIGTPNQLAEMPGHASLSPSVGIVTSAREEGIVAQYRNEQQHLGALTPETHNGGYLGRTVAFHQSGMIELSGLVIYGRSLDADERLHAVQAVEENFAIPQQQQDTYVADGDSITQGLGSMYNQGYPWYMERLLPRSLILYNAGWAAKTLGGPGGLVERYDHFTSRLYNPHARINLISILAGTNDIANHSSGQEVFQLIAQYAAAARRTGFKVVVGTILPRATFDAHMEYERVQANVLLRSNWRNFANGLADFAADPALGSVGATSNAAVFISDGVHPTDYGYQIMASDLATVINDILGE